MASYQETSSQLIDEHAKTAARLKEEERGLTYSREEDEEKTRLLKSVIYDVLTGKSKKKRPRYFTLPSWRRVHERTGDYFVLNEMLRRRTNQSTWSRLKECGLLG
jgi:hypothetical protein